MPPCRFQTKNASNPIKDTLVSAISAVGYPNMPEEASATAGGLEKDAATGASLVNQEPPQTLYEKLHGDEGLQNIKTQGNQGQGHDSGLKAKGVQHQEELAERSRIARAGEWEPHAKHGALKGAHGDAATESQDPPSLAGGGVGKVVNEQKLI
ncbi:hypothetical protein JCM10213v2_004305 [Rhodosporidiobolus nylandii]